MSRCTILTRVACAVLMVTVHAHAAAALADTGAIRGTVVDPQGGIVAAATVTLLKDGQSVTATTSDARGEFSFNGLAEGRYQLDVSAPGFERQTTDAMFIGGSGHTSTQVALQVGGVKQEVVVTASAIALPEARTGAAVTVVDAEQIAALGAIDVLQTLRDVPGVSVVQVGGRGGTTSLFIRGGNANFNKVLIDGVPANDIGGAFDFADLSTTGVDRVEVMRGSNTVLYGSDAMTGVVSIVTKRGRSAIPEFTYAIDGGNLGTLRNDVSIGGVAKRYDYFSEYSYFRTDNDLPHNRFTNGVFAGRFGAAITSGSSLSVTVRRKDADAQLPNATLFNGISDDAFQESAFTTVGATVQAQASDRLRATARFGSTQQKYRYENPTPTGQPFDPFGFGANYLGNQVTIRGANGTSTTGRAILDYGGTYPAITKSKTNRQSAFGQVDFQAARLFDVSGGIRFEHEAGFSADAAEPEITRNNAGVFGELRATVSRVHATAGLGYDHNEVFGSAVSPRVSVAAFLNDPSRGKGNDTKLVFNAGKGIKAPSVFQEQSSLFALVGSQAGALGVAPAGAERTRSVDVGIEQGFWAGRGRVRVSYFRNRFDDLLDYISKSVLPQLGVSQDAANAAAFGAYVNSQSFRARGIETSADVQANRMLRITASYTHLDAEVLRSFSDGALAPAINPAYPNTPIGQYGPLIGARPFRRPPNVGNLTVTYARGKAQLGVSGYFSGKSDDSTFLSDEFFGYSMVLPNKDLDGGYAKVDVSGTYQFHRMLRWQISIENALNRDYQAGAGFAALPATFRTGITVLLGGTRQP